MEKKVKEIICQVENTVRVPTEPKTLAEQDRDMAVVPVCAHIGAAHTNLACLQQLASCSSLW